MNFKRTSIKNPGKSIAAIYSCFLVLLICFSQPTNAAFTDSITIGSPKALALGHAVTADPPDIDSIHFNPAGLTRLKGRKMFVKGIVGLFSTEMELGEYGKYTKDLHEKYRLDHEFLKDEDGNLLYGRSPWEEFVYDEALNSKSKSEGGPTIMLPGGMVDLPIGAGMSGGASYSPPGSPFTFGTNVYAPLMNGFHRSEDDPGRFAQQRVAFTVITYFSPTVAYEVSDELSIGLSINFNYAGMGMELPIREPHEAIFFVGSTFIQKTFCNEDGTPNESNDLTGTRIDLCTEVSPYSQYAELSFEVDQNIVLGFNVGLLWQPQPWLSLGLSYNSAIDVTMDGDFEWPVNDPFKSFLVNFQSSPGWEDIVNSVAPIGIQLPTAEQIDNDISGPMTVSYQVPQRWNVGLSVQLTPKWKYNFDVRWTEWSAFSNIDLDFGVDVPLLMWGGLADEVGTGGANGISSNSVAYQLGLQDVTYWGMGTEYQYSERLALRAGYERRPSAVPEDAPNAFIPMNDGNLMSVGLGYDFGDERYIDFAIGYFKSETHYPPCTASLGNGCDISNVVYPVYMGQDIKTKVEFLLFELGYSQPF